MIISLSGDDKVKIGDFILQYKTKYETGSVYILDKNSNLKLKNLTQSQGLFSQKKLIIVTNPKTQAELEDEKWLGIANQDKELDLLIDLSSLNANLKLFKTIKKLSKNFNFILPRDYSFFNLCDAIFLKKDKVEAIRIINSLSGIEDKFLPLLATLQSSLRNFISIKYKNKASAAIHPFMAKKIASYKLTEKEVEKLYAKLLEMDLKSKTMKVDKKALLIDYVLYFL